MAVMKAKHLDALKAHKYSVVNNSFLDNHVMPAFWNWLVQKLPMWVAPNLLTVGGLAFIFGPSLLLAFQCPGFTCSEDLSPIYLGAAAFGVFVYQTMDALDGKQARRTGSSSPLGELMDHGCDAMSTVGVLGSLLMVLLGSSSWLGLFVLAVAAMMFYLYHWRAFFVHHVEFGVFDVTEIQYTLIFTYIVTMVFGVGMWRQEVTVPYLQQECTLGELFALLLTVCSLPTFLTVTFATFKTAISQEGVLMGIFRPIRYTFSFFLLSAIALTWAAMSPSNALENNGFAFMYLYGVSAGEISSRIVLAHMCKAGDLVPYLLPSHFIFALIWAGEHFAVLSADVMPYVLGVAVAFEVLYFLLYVRKVTSEICKSMGIKLFVIDYKKE
eukprot:CAMPEP_0113881828 /NCGR_PEP_ID=MMETSP0780_2-20120614/8598_1 /TAXON_ID=652834 /ORGANISM="Palpitomonas bilix" /LENGTH=382 /DNA_ID=CAMNT_0000868739 /DNA_START=23 /DNA_END=1171 /DNA_ORIENTATION=- /assembly_acc=CAM_ASM_000599